MDSMWMFDFHLFYQAGRAVLMGLSPATIAVNYSPYPLAVLFVPFALLPEPLAYALFVLLNLFLLWRVMGRRIVWAVLSFPVLFTLFVGQVDLVLALAIPLGMPWTLALALAKPQVGFVVLPWLLHRLDFKGWLKAAAAGVAFLAVCFILRPSWLSEWLQSSPGLVFYSLHASNLDWLVPNVGSLRAIVTVVLAVAALAPGFLLRQKRDSCTLLQLFQPLSNFYSISVLAEWFGPLEVGLSWAAVLLAGGNIHAGMPMFMVALAILARPYWRSALKRLFLLRSNDFSRYPRIHPAPQSLASPLAGVVGNDQERSQDGQDQRQQTPPQELVPGHPPPAEVDQRQGQHPGDI